MTTTIFIIVMLLILVVGVYFIPRFLVRKAVKKVVALFRAREATSPATALTAQELGLVQPRFMDRMFRMRDYRPHALRALVQANIIKVTEDGALYLSEEELERSPIRDFVGVS